MTHLGELMRPKNESIIQGILGVLRREAGEPTNPSLEIQKKHKLSRQQVQRYFKLLTENQQIQKIGQGKGTKYFIAPKLIVPHIEMSVNKLTELGEDQVFEKYFKPQIQFLPKNIISIINHGLTEMLNNVIDHSQGRTLETSLCQSLDLLIIKIKDDGIGVFEKNRQAFQCADLFEAVVETFKGKRTSDPENHAGEGIFFTSRLFDFFTLKANNLVWEFQSIQNDWGIKEQKTKKGTELIFGITINSNRTPKETFKKYTDDNFEFNKGALLPVEPLTLKAGIEHVSRSEARRLLAGIEKFKHVEIDFRNTETIGQGFADEVFRVFQSKHPDILIKPIHMNPIVEAMIKHVIRK
jgi:anti-sigma regulatory factor (Ser/Thr protein kinase)